MLLSRNKKNNVYPCKPQFYYIKVGFKVVKIIKACFHDGFHCLPEDATHGGPCKDPAQMGRQIQAHTCNLVGNAI